MQEIDEWTYCVGGYHCENGQCSHIFNSISTGDARELCIDLNECAFRKHKWPTPAQFEKEYVGFPFINSLTWSRNPGGKWTMNKFNHVDLTREDCVIACTPWGCPPQDWGQSARRLAPAELMEWRNSIDAIGKAVRKSGLETWRPAFSMKAFDDALYLAAPMVYVGSKTEEYAEGIFCCVDLDKAYALDTGVPHGW